MPTIPKPKPLPWNLPKPRIGSNQKYYNSTSHRKQSIKYRKLHPVCEVCASKGIVKPVIQQSKRVGVMDHIIPIETGGSRTDENNLMSMCTICHNKKRSLESQGITVASDQIRTGLIPKDRNDIIKLLNK